MSPKKPKVTDPPDVVALWQTKDELVRTMTKAQRLVRKLKTLLTSISERNPAMAKKFDKVFSEVEGAQTDFDTMQTDIPKWVDTAVADALAQADATKDTEGEAAALDTLTAMLQKLRADIKRTTAKGDPGETPTPTPEPGPEPTPEPPTGGGGETPGPTPEPTPAPEPSPAPEPPTPSEPPASGGTT